MAYRHIIDKAVPNGVQVSARFDVRVLISPAYILSGPFEVRVLISPLISGNLKILDPGEY